MPKSQLDELAKIAMSFGGSPSFLKKYGCNTLRQQKLEKSIGGGFLRPKAPSKKRKNISAMTDEELTDFLM